MEAETKEIIKEKEYVHGTPACWNDYDGYGYGYGYRRRGVDNSARALGIVGTVAGGLALLNGIHGNRGGLFGGNYGTPENVNINTLMPGAGSSVAPTAFQAWEKECSDNLALTNTIWELQLNSERQMYAHRETDVNEKFQLYKSQIDADFLLYKGYRDADDAIIAKHNADVFSLYKGNRDGFDALNARISNLEKEVAVNTAIRPYQDKLIQCEIERAYTAGINYTDRKTCRAIMGELVLPSTPTVTGYPSYTACSCPQTTQAAG